MGRQLASVNLCLAAVGSKNSAAVFSFFKFRSFSLFTSGSFPPKTPLSDRPSELRLWCCVADSVHVTPSLFSFVVRRFERTRETWFGERKSAFIQAQQRANERDPLAPCHTPSQNVSISSPRVYNWALRLNKSTLGILAFKRSKEKTGAT